MTADQLIRLAFEDHWFFTTFFFPWAAFLYAYLTSQYWWMVGAFVMGLIGFGIRSAK